MNKELLDFDHINIGNLTGESRIKKSRVSKRDIAIIGTNAKMSFIRDINGFWKCLREGIDCISNFPENRRRDVEAYLRYKGVLNKEINYPLAGYLKDVDKFDYNFFNISPKEASLMDPTQRLFLEAAWGVIEDAGYGGDKITGSRTGVYVGFKSSLSDAYQRMIYDTNFSSLELSAAGNTPAIVASRIAYILDLRGPAMLVDTTCSSSLVALHLACQGIRNGECDMAIAGGIKIKLFPIEGGNTMGIESSDGRTRTFDDSSNGTGTGEGVGAVLLKPLDKALEDRDSIYAVIKGSAINQDGRSNGIAAPNPAAQEDVIVRAWKDAGINPDTISYIEAHGTGTKLGDPIEIDGLQRAFRRYTKRKRFCGIGSVKTNMGHLDNAAGIAGLLKAVLALKHGEIPPSLHFSRANRNINFVESPFYVNNSLRKWEKSEHPRRCGISAFGLSGTNCHVVLEEAPGIHTETKDRHNGPNVLTLSAKSKASMVELLHRFRKFIEEESRYDLRDVCYTASTGRGHYGYRLTMVFQDRDDLLDKMNNFSILKPGTGRGVYYGRHKVVPANKSYRKGADITESERARMNNDAVRIMEKINLNEDGREKLIHSICNLYVKGAYVEWERIYKDEKRRKINLPVYPFERKRCWVETGLPESLKSHEDDLFYTVKWKHSELEYSKNLDKRGNILVFKSKNRISEEIVEGIKGHKNIIEVSLGSKYEKTGGNSYIISGSAADYKALVNDIEMNNIARIIHLFALDIRENAASVEILEENQKIGVYSVLHLTRAMFDLDIHRNINIVLVAGPVNFITGREQRIIPENAILFGLGKVIGQENRRFKCTCIDVDESVNMNMLCQEAEHESGQVIVALREGKRFIETIEKNDISSIPDINYSLKEEGAYIITGGNSGIGLEIAKYLSCKGKINLALVNRTALPPRTEWDNIIKIGKSGKRYETIQALRKIEQSGSKVINYSADVGKIEEIREVINNLRKTYGRINGVVHSAGIAGDGFLINKEEQEFEKVLAPKVRGTWILERLTREDDTDFFIMCSSFTSFRGAPGQGDYTGANSYLDAFADLGRIKGRRMLTINWPAWKETGMALRYGVNRDGVFKAITTDRALSAFDILIRKDISRAVVGEINADSDILFNLPISVNIAPDVMDYISIKSKDNAEKKVKNESSDWQKPGVFLKGRPGDNYSDYEVVIAGVWGEILGLNEIDVEDDFFDLGGDSIYQMKVIDRLNSQTGSKMSLKDLFKYSTIKEMAEYLNIIHDQGRTPNSITAQNNCKQELSDKEESDTGSKMIPQKKLLRNIEPFNDIYFRSCYYNSLFPIVRHFDSDIIPFLVNDVPVYCYTKTENIVNLNIQYISAKKTEELFFDSNIDVEARSLSDTIINDIEYAISINRPVIVFVDCFYESIRTDMYRKQHWEHALLIYGYDRDAKEFHVIEQNSMETLSYKKTVISYFDLKNSYYGYIENFNKDKHARSYFEYSSKLNHEEKNRDYFKIYASNIVRNDVNILNRLSFLREFAEDYNHLITNDDLLSPNISNLVKSVNQIINARKAELYILNGLQVQDADLKQLSNKIIRDWNYIRGILGKYYYSSVYNLPSLNKVYKTLTILCDQEEKYYKLMISRFIAVK